jgi:hypothetical protein
VFSGYGKRSCAEYDDAFSRIYMTSALLVALLGTRENPSQLNLKGFDFRS